MGALMRALDWSTSSLGPPDRWPQTLRTVVRLMLNSNHPMYVWWGPDLACLYNDAYRLSIGPERHPSSLGRPAREVWDEIWHVIHPQIEFVLAGHGATWQADHLVPITRNGRREDVYWTYSYSPIDDESAADGVGGVLVVCTETTEHVLATRRLGVERDQLAQLFEQAPSFMALLSGPQHRFDIINPAYQRLVGDRPLIGLPVAAALPDAAAQGYVALLDRVYTSGEAFAARGARFDSQARPGGPVVTRYVDFVYQPIKNPAGEVTGVFVEGADVTPHVETTVAMQASDARFRAALRAGRMGSWETDHATKTRQWSEEGMALFGLDLPGGIGQVGGEHDEYARAMHPQDRHMVERFRELAAVQDSFPAEYRVVKPDGSVLWLAGSGLVVARNADGSPLRLVSIMADHTERRLAEERLKVERERLALALSAGAMGAYDLDIDKGVLWWSPQTYALFGVTPDRFVPTPEAVSAFIHPDDRESFRRLRSHAIAQHRQFVHELRSQRLDGTQVWLGYRGQAEYDANGRPLRNYGVIMDITERKQAEQRLHEADRQKDIFIAMLAHELRNPLAPVRNAVHLLRRNAVGDNPTVQWCHDVIDRQVTQMARLLDDLLDVSRLSRGELKIHRQRVALATVLEHAIEIARPVIDAAGHTFNIDTAPDPMPLDGDPTRLPQVFANVLINAAKYTPRGGDITLMSRRTNDEAIVTIADNGIGISADQLPRIFEMFHQVDAATSTPQSGQGVGLSLARRLVELHHGALTARSAGLGRGAEFEIRLPLPEGEAPVADHATLEASAADHRRQRVLVADDLRDAADSLAAALTEAGHSVSVAYDGVQALAVAQALRPDVAVLDLGMPGRSGHEVCEAIRASDWGRGMLLIALSGWGQARDIAASREAGFDHHFVKPVDRDELIARFTTTRRTPAG